MMRRTVTLIGFALSVALGPASIDAQQPGELNLTATSANVSEPGAPLSIRILRWSTDDERAPLVAALTPRAPTATAPASTASDAAAARGARAGAGRGGRGRGRGRGDAAAPLTPIAAFTAAIGRAPTVGYIWTNGVTGYAIKYAYHAPLPDGSERIILATDRRLGAYTTAWRPATMPVTDYEFTLVEVHLPSNGSGEGKTSLTANVIVDSDAKTVALENYAAATAILQNVRR
jgi:hypothetical protein